MTKHGLNTVAAHLLPCREFGANKGNFSIVGGIGHVDEMLRIGIVEQVLFGNVFSNRGDI